MIGTSESDIKKKNPPRMRFRRPTTQQIMLPLSRSHFPHAQHEQQQRYHVQQQQTAAGAVCIFRQENIFGVRRGGGMPHFADRRFRTCCGPNNFSLWYLCGNGRLWRCFDQ